jgi:hypothetical protein
MKKQLCSHPYQDRKALNRLLLLIALFARSPGIGYPDDGIVVPDGEHHNALALVAVGLKQLAIDLNLEISAASVHTLRKDLEFLRKCGVIEERMYRWGYYLGTGVFSPQELPIALQAIKDIGERLGDPTIDNLLYHDVAWYLICEEIDSGYLAAIRLDRLSGHLQQLTELPPRGRAAQLDRLKVVDRLLKNGWGISLGSREQQIEELNGGGSIEVEVRFFEEVVSFIREGEKRHPRQQIALGKKNVDGKLTFINYSVVLPERSLDEFFRWVRRFGSQALVLAPEKYVLEFRQEVSQLARLYLA